MNVIHLTNSISDSDGVSMHVLQLIKTLDPLLSRQALITGKVFSAEKFNEAGIQVIEHPEFFHANRSIANFTKAAKLLRRLCKEYEINVMHSHSHYAANIAYYVSQIYTCLTVQTIHGLIPDVGRLRHFKADKFICVSEPAFDKLQSDGIDKNRLHLIRQGVDKNSYKTRVRFTGNSITILFASRMVHEKGPDIFLKAVEQVAKNHDNVIFQMAGTGEMLNEVLRAIEKSKANIGMLGEVKDMQHLLYNADIFVMPGRTADEGFPMSIAEAAVSGCLIISSGFDALNHVFKSGTDGYSFKIEDSQELAEKLISAISNKKRSAEMAEHFHKHAVDLFDVERFASEHMRVYHD